jgi:ribosome-binding protein aMBF1 (putative translation factor)
MRRTVMVKYFCDVCGKEVNGNELDVEYIGRVRFELCAQCERTLDRMRTDARLKADKEFLDTNGKGHKEAPK